MTEPDKYPRQTGTVTAWDDFHGFIEADAGSTYFVHAAAVQRVGEAVNDEGPVPLLRVGDRVEFQGGGRHPGPKAQQADAVVVIEP